MSTRGVKPGDVLGGKYKVERVLGAGGMGIVVAARHVDLGQLVALKFMLKEAMTDPSHAERFLREAKAAVQLKSAHTARVLDVGRLNNGEPFMVMEYLQGRDLDAELEARGPLPPHVAVDYILQASEALAEAHGLGMIHRDVKLKNLFLTRTVDGRPLVKMLDFGLAKRLGAHNDVSLTATNTVFGSPQYMSPEQMRSSKDVDSRSDIWSLGVCLYELVTGRAPFEAAGVAEICAMVLKDPVPPPSEFVRGLPRDLEEVILKCLEKDVNRRFQSVAELAFALQAYATDEGSARRILYVMQTAQSVDHATLFMTGSDVVQAESKTISAWDSNLPARGATARLSRPQLFAAIAALALGLIGMTTIVLTFKSKAKVPVAAASVASSSPDSREPPPVDPSAPLATVTATATATATATGASPVNTGETPSTADPSPALAPAKLGGSRPIRPSGATTHVTAAKTPPSPTPTPTPSPKPTKPKNTPGSGADYM